MITLERLPAKVQEPTVDRVANLDYLSLLDEAVVTAGRIGVSGYMQDKTFGLLEDLHTFDAESAIGGLRTMPIALDLAGTIADFYEIEIDSSTIFVSSLLHDIGKKELPKELLQKSSDGLEWTSDDAYAMSRHVTFGGMLMKQAGFSQVIIRAVEEHHHKQLGGREYGVDTNLSNEERICRDSVAIADFAEADLNRTNSRNRHLNRDQRETQIAEDIAYVLGDYSDSADVARAVTKQILGY